MHIQNEEDRKFVGSVWYRRRTQQNIFNVSGALYAATLFLGVSNSSSVQPVMSVERGVFYRERAAGKV